jgi:aspartate/methionine/tyrosine aminotransferase
MISKRSIDIPPFLVMDVLEKAQEMETSGKNVIHLEIGEPDFDTPPKIIAAAKNALDNRETHYTHSLGITPLREAICGFYQKKYGVAVSPDRIIVTMGTSAGLLLTLCALLDPGDEILLFDPAYACYPNFIRYIGGVPVTIPVYAENGFVPPLKEIKSKITKRTKALLINSPSNPTGIVLPKDFLQDISEPGVPVISDEIYHGLVYGEKEHSFLEFADKAFVLNGFSKYYAMTGWRLGWVVMPPEFVRPMQKSQQNLFICASSIAQRAGVVALTEHHPELDEMVRIYGERRRYIIDALKGLGFGVHVEPTGAFYVLADAKWLNGNSYDLAFDILKKVNLAVTPGIDFGPNAEGFLRFSYANCLKNIEEGMSRLKSYIDKWG